MCRGTEREKERATRRIAGKIAKIMSEELTTIASYLVCTAENDGRVAMEITEDQFSAFNISKMSLNMF